MQLDSDGHHDTPMIADYGNGSVIEVLNDETITQVIVVDGYDGRCPR